MTTNEVAKLLHYTPEYINQLCNKGILVAHKTEMYIRNGL